MLTFFKIDNNLRLDGVVINDFAEAPAAVQAIITCSHGFEFRASGNQFWISFNESVYGLFVHNKLQMLFFLGRKR